MHYARPALDDLLDVTSRVSERRRASFTFKYEIHNEKRELVAHAHAPRVLGPRSRKMVALPDWLKEIMLDGDLDPPAVRS